jgi:tripartite-type tricarboxylate transporter receptor subunit TctC
MISGFPPGGAVDVLARVFADEWSKAIGRPAIVENITGAGGLLAMQNLKNSPPDGNTLAVSTDSSLIVYPHTAAKPAYNTFTDFTPIAQTGTTVYALAIGSHVPTKSLAEFIAWAKANPDKSSFGASGAGSALQFYGILVSQTVNMPFTHVPYKGVGPSVADMIAGQIAASVVPIGTVVPQVKAGKARVLAHSGTARVASLPEVPTFKELGYPTLESPVWFGIVGPGGMAPDLAAKLNEIFVQAMRKPEIRERMARLDLEIREMSAPQFAAQLKSDYERWGKIVKASGWKPE